MQKADSKDYRSYVISAAIGLSIFLFGLFSDGVSRPTLIIISISIFLLLFVLVKQIDAYGDKENQYTKVKGREGKELIKPIKAAERSIVLTTFSEDKPSPKYLKALMKKLNDNVSITRFITQELENNRPEWLKQFDKNSMPNYEEKVIQGKALPFDVYIFDEKLTYAYFPPAGEHKLFKEGSVFHSTYMASNYRAALDKSTQI
ncbi:hypothetical protein EYS14_15000 [Alteromonadaceae bacterium M269]|nr:hypothetical protein EYS14_15000 [Alteromonadaceae bacterium M269]